MQAHNPDFMVFTGTANTALAESIVQHLGTTLGAAAVGRFSDGEVNVEIKQTVRARDVFVVQSTCAPTNDNLMELLIMVDALKRASAERISALTRSRASSTFRWTTSTPRPCCWATCARKTTTT